MVRLRFASIHVPSAILLTTFLTATASVAADRGRAAAQTREQLAAQFEQQLAESLLVLVPSARIEAKVAAKNRNVPSAFDDLNVPRSSLVAALLASKSYGLQKDSEFGAAEFAAGNASQQGGRRPVSPNGPPDGPPGPPDGVPPGPPDGVPGPPDGVPGRPDGIPPGPPNR